MVHPENCANNARCFCGLLVKDIGGDKGSKEQKIKGMINPKYSCALIAAVNIFMFTADFLEIFQQISLTSTTHEAQVFRSIQFLLCALQCSDTNQEVTTLAGLYKHNNDQYNHPRLILHF